MDADKIMLTGAVLPQPLLEHLGGALSQKQPLKWEPNRLYGLSEDQKSQVAKDFESVFISKLLDELKNTIGDWGLEKDEVSEHIQGIFWLYLARDIANKGGFGLWQDIYKFLTDSEKANTASSQSLDKSL